jgi:hypothetical protein
LDSGRGWTQLRWRSLLYVAARSRTRPGDLEKAVQAFRSLDIEAFRNLVDSDEEAFLRDHLPPRKFREIKRQRAWAAFIYAAGKRASRGALAMVGQAAQRSADPGSQPPVAQLPKMLFGFACRPSGLASTC